MHTQAFMAAFLHLDSINYKSITDLLMHCQEKTAILVFPGFSRLFGFKIIYRLFIDWPLFWNQLRYLITKITNGKKCSLDG
jgi:hypothetical protein